MRSEGYACSGGEGLERERRALRHDGVAESLQPRPSAFGRFADAGRLPGVLSFAAACGPSVIVQPAGKPISISTHSGVIAFPACDTSDPAYPFALAPPLQSCVVGVAHFTTSAEILVTGIKVVDLLAPYARGGKIGLFGGAGVGKTVFIQELIVRITFLSFSILCTTCLFLDL